MKGVPANPTNKTGVLAAETSSCINFSNIPTSCHITFIETLTLHLEFPLMSLYHLRDVDFSIKNRQSLTIILVVPLTVEHGTLQIEDKGNPN